jgi:hypothetical protein
MLPKSLIKAEEIPSDENTSNELLEPIPGTGRFSLTDKGRRIMISRVTGIFDDTSPELYEFKKQNPDIKFNFDSNKSLKFQLVTLLILHPKIGFTREDLIAFIEKVELQSGDVIQAVNKTPQWGLKRWKKSSEGKTFYSIPYPLEFDNSKLKIRTGPIRKLSEKEKQIDKFKSYINATFLEDEDWHWGHRDPDNGNEAGLVVQPAAYNRAHKDHYKFDQNGLKECPTASYLLQDPSRFYTREEVEKIVSGLAEYLQKED